MIIIRTHCWALAPMSSPFPCSSLLQSTPARDVHDARSSTPDPDPDSEPGPCTASTCRRASRPAATTSTLLSYRQLLNPPADEVVAAAVEDRAHTARRAGRVSKPLLDSTDIYGIERGLTESRRCLSRPLRVASGAQVSEDRRGSPQPVQLLGGGLRAGRQSV